jgi:alpha-tubulin suppressor-like RCC1 family protein
MKKMMRYCTFGIAVALLAALLAACGGGGASVTSSVSPAVFYAHSVAFRNGSTLVAWGNDGFGQLGNNSTVNALIPVVVLGGAGMKGFAVGGTHTLAFNNHTTLAWGNNGFGQLGEGTLTARAVPFRVLKSVVTGGTTSFPTLSNVIAVAAGGNHSLALVQVGPTNTSVWAWGSNVFGQLGDQTVTNRAAAVQVSDIPPNGAFLVGVTKIAAGGSHSLALRSNGSVSSWGYNGFGQLGQRIRFQNLSTLNRTFPDQVLKVDASTVPPGTASLTNVTDIAAGGSHSLAVVNDGPDPSNPDTARVWAWGYNILGQLGDGTIIDKPNAVQILVDTNNAPFKGVIAVAAGADHSLALKSDGTVWAWGFNFFGQLGNGVLGSNDPVTRPVQVLVGPAPGTPLVLSANAKIFAIGNHSLAINGNTVWAWGDNTFGQLGNNTVTNSAFAVRASGFQ